MKAVSLNPQQPAEGQEVIYAADQPQYLPLPAWRWPGPEGLIVTRWRLSWRERLRAFLGGDLYLVISTFHQPLQPLFPTWDRGAVIDETPR